jgi:hypothetical protein
VSGGLATSPLLANQSNPNLPGQAELWQLVGEWIGPLKPDDPRLLSARSRPDGQWMQAKSEIESEMRVHGIEPEIMRRDGFIIRDCPCGNPNPDFSERIDPFDGRVLFRILCAKCRCNGTESLSREVAVDEWNETMRRWEAMR